MCVILYYVRVDGGCGKRENMRREEAGDGIRGPGTSKGPAEECGVACGERGRAVLG